MHMPINPHRKLLLALLMLGAVTFSAGSQARIIDWVGIFTDINVEITQAGFDKEALTVQIGDDINIYNESGREIRVVASGNSKITIPPITNGGSARISIPRPGSYQFFCDKMVCKKALNVLVTERN